MLCCVNAPEDIDKLCYISLTDDKVNLNIENFHILAPSNEMERTIIFSGNGLGMTR